MTHSAKILAHSISPDGVPLATMEVVFLRIVLAEFNTHRMFSRNSASSRAIPVKKMISTVQEHPYVPTEWPLCVWHRGPESQCTFDEHHEGPCSFED
jgi:hypothetical protein